MNGAGRGNALDERIQPLESRTFRPRHGQVARLFYWLVTANLGLAQSTTTISGTVYMPNGTVPLPNVLVYVTNGSVTLPASGANCTSSSVTAAEGCITQSTVTPTVVTSGTGVYAYTTTGADGTFTLGGVPEGNSYTLVIQSGKWLNEFTEPSSGTLSGPISGLQLNMPTTHSATANIPLIAIQTGSADALECVFRDIGVASTEFTDDSVTQRAFLWRAHPSLSRQRRPDQFEHAVLSYIADPSQTEQL